MLRSRHESISARALRSALDRGTGPARLHRKAAARSDRETWAGSGNENNSGRIFGESVKYLSKVARSKVDQDNSARWGTAGRRQPRKPTSRTTTRLINRNSNSVETKATTPGIYIYGLQPVPPCIPYSKTEPPRGRLSELFCSSGTSAAAQPQPPEGSGESNPVHGGVGGVGGGGGGGGGGSGVPAELFGSFSRDVRLRQAEERDNNVVSSRECAVRDLQSFFRRTSKQRGYGCRWRLGEPRSREEEHRSLVHRQMSDEGEMNSTYHDDGDSCSDDAAATAAAAAAASSQGVINTVISQCSADVVGPDQSTVDAPSLSKLRLYVIAAWTGGVIDAAIARTTGPGEINLGEKRWVQSSPDSPVRNARVVASQFMADVTEVCLMYAVLTHDLRLTTTAGESDTAAPSSAVMTRTEPSHDCARRPVTGHHPTLTEGRKDGEDTPVVSRVPNASANSPRVHGGVAHIFFPAPPCSTSLVPPDSTQHRSCTGIPSLLKEGGTCSSALFSRLDRGEAEDVDDRPTLAASSVLNSGNLTNAMEDGAAADMLMRRIYDTVRENSKKPDKNKKFAPIDTPIDNKPRAIPKDESTVHYCGTAKSAVHSCGTASQLETRARETCARGGSTGRAQAALEVGFAGVGTRPAEAVPRSSVSARWTRKGGGFLFRKRRCPPRNDCTGGGYGGGSSTDGGGEESMASLLSASAIGHGESVETTPPSFTTGSPRGEPVDSSGVEVGLDSGATVGRKAVLQARRRHGQHVASDSPPKGAGTGVNFDTGIAHTIYGVAMGGSSGATNGSSLILAERSVEESPAVFRYRVPVPDQHALTSGPGRDKVFPVTDERTGAGVEACRGTGGDGSAATESTGGRAEGRVSIRAAVDTDEACSILPWSLQPKPPHGAKGRSLPRSPRKILYTSAAVIRPRYGGGSQASDSSSRRPHISTARGRENNDAGGQQALRTRTGRDGKSLPATVAAEPSPRDRP